ncbi:MAG: hypothetical protein ACYCPT_02440 [Acidimicrobiales bacterium]
MGLFRRSKKNVDTDATKSVKIEEATEAEAAHNETRAQFRGSGGSLGFVHPNVDDPLKDEEFRSDANPESDTNKELLIEQERRREQGYER